MSNTRTYLTRNIFFLCAVVLTALIALAWQLSTTYYSDDIPYRNIVCADDCESFWHSQGRNIESFGDIVNSIVNHFLYINGRLANIIYISFQLVPYWVSSLFCALSMTGMFCGLACVCIPRRMRGNVWLLLLMLLCYWCVFPWYDTFQSADYQINYSTTSALLCLFIYFFVHSSRFSDATFRVALVSSFFIGWMHEGFTIPLLTYSVVSMYFNRSDIRRKFWLVGAAFVGLIVNLAGSTFHRAFVAMNEDPYAIMPYVATRIIIGLWPCWLAAVVSALVYFRLSSALRLLFLRSVLPVFSASLVGCGIVFVLVRIDRVFWPANFFAVITLFSSLRFLIRFSATPRRRSVLFFAFSMCVYMLWGASLCHWQRKVSSELDNLYAMAEPRESKTHDTYFCDMTMPFETPFWLMQIPVHMLFSYPYENGAIADYYRHESGSVLILPESFRYLDYEDWPDIPGCNGFKGKFPVFVTKKDYNGLLRMKFEGILPSATPLNLLIIALRERSFDKPVVAIDNFNKFRVALPDGDSAYYIMPNHLPRTVICRRFVSVDTIAGAD